MPKQVEATDESKTTTEDIGDFVTETNDAADEHAEEQEQSASAQETEQTEEIAAASEATENEDAETEGSEESEEDQADPADPATEENRDKGKKKGGFQRKLDKVTKARREAERERDYWRDQFMLKNPQKTETAGDPNPKPIETKADPSRPIAPDPDKFDTHAEYLKAHNEYVDKLTDWKYDQRTAADKKVARENAVKTEYEGLKQKHFERVGEFRKSHADWAETLESIGDVRMSPTVEHAILDSDNSAELLYAFAKDPEEFKRICSLTPEKATRAIGRFESKIDSAPSTATPKNPLVTSEKKVTTAPKPISTINSKAGHVKTSRDELPFDEWAPIRRQELKAAGR